MLSPVKWLSADTAVHLISLYRISRYFQVLYQLFVASKLPRTFEVIASEYRWELYKVVYGVLQIKVKA